MNHTSSTETRQHAFPAVILASALVGSAFALAELWTRAGLLSCLPLTTQLATISCGWYGGFALGAVIGAGVEVVGRLSRWRVSGAAGGFPAVWVTLGVLVALTVAGNWGTSRWSAAVVGIVAGLAATAVLTATGRVLPGIGRRLFWGCLNLMALVVLIYLLAVTGPLRHGGDWWGAMLVIPPLVISVLAWSVPASMGRTIATLAVPIALVLGLHWLAVPWLGRVAAPLTESPNVLLVTIDTMRGDHAGYAGNEWIRTPTLDALASEGVAFENAVTPIPLTNPSHTTMLSGLLPGHHGVTNNFAMPLREGVVTLPEILAGEGYLTAAFVSGSTLRRQYCVLRDRFQLFDDDFSPLRLVPDPCFRLASFRMAIELVRAVGLLSSSTPQERPAALAVRDAVDWLEANGGHRFFLWVHLFDPHGAYEPPPPFDTLYDPDYRGPATGDWYSITIEERLQRSSDPSILEHTKALYAGEVSYADREVGRVVAALDRLDLAGNTLTIVTSDHGESLTEHDYYFDHSVCLYDPSLRVPLVFRHPERYAAGSRRSDLVDLTDLTPTVLAFLGLAVPEDLDGAPLHPFSPAPAGESGRSAAVSAIHRPGVHGGAQLLAVRTLTAKYIRTSPWYFDLRLMPGYEEFYDLVADPGETVNLIDEEPPQLAVLRSVADAYWQTWFEMDAPEVPALSDEALEMLRSLGYIQ
jgi:arylsulfatase A-like enzyme